MVDDIDAGDEIERRVIERHAIADAALVIHAIPKGCDVSLQIGVSEVNVKPESWIDAFDAARLVGEVCGREPPSQAPDTHFQRSLHVSSHVLVKWPRELAMPDQFIQQSRDVEGVLDPVAFSWSWSF